MGMLRRSAAISVLMLACGIASPCVAQTALDAAEQTSDWKQIDEAWYTIAFDGSRAGWANEFTFDNGTEYRTVSEQFMAIRRGGGDTVEIRMMFTFVETHDGAPVRIESESLLGPAPEKRIFHFQDDGSILESTDRGGRTTKNRIAPIEGTWFMPQAAGRFEAARRKAGAESFEYRTVDVSGGFNLVRVVQRAAGEETYSFEDRAIPVTVWEVESTLEGGDTTQKRTAKYSAADQELLEATERLGAWTITTRRTSRAQALAALESAPEVMIRSFVALETRIPGAHRSTAATYRVELTEGDPYAFPEAGYQRVEVDEAGAVTLHVDLHDPVQATEEDAANEALLGSSSLIECEDEAIVRFAKDSLRGAGDDPRERARALHRAVYRHIRNKNLGTAFASARETLDSRSGDCSEHGVLLCALLRADGIPARVASGLVYVDAFERERHVFGWHMWTQALIDGEWIDLDATLPRPFSAAHILTGVSDLANGAMNEEFARLATLMGRLRIEVVEVGYDQSPD